MYPVQWFRNRWPISINSSHCTKTATIYTETEDDLHDQIGRDCVNGMRRNRQRWFTSSGHTMVSKGWTCPSFFTSNIWRLTIFCFNCDLVKVSLFQLLYRKQHHDWTDQWNGSWNLSMYRYEWSCIDHSWHWNYDRKHTASTTVQFICQQFGHCCNVTMGTRWRKKN